MFSDDDCGREAYVGYMCKDMTLRLIMKTHLEGRDGGVLRRDGTRLGIVSVVAELL